MNEKRDTRGLSPASDAIADLLRSAGPRSLPDADRMAAARETVHAAWRETVLAHKRRRFLWLAASLAAVAVGAIVLATFRSGSDAPLATVSRIMGDVRIHGATGSASPSKVQGGEILAAGTQIETGPDGRVLLTWGRNVHLRVDRESLVSVPSAREFELIRGTVYVEVPKDAQAEPFAVSTRFGDVRHIGTRFEVHVADDHVRVRVRDGQAVFSGQSGERSTTILAGQQLSANASTVELEPGPAAHDEAWAWTQQIAPVFEIEGRPLTDALAWLSHESGLRVIFENERAREQARQTILRGTISGLDCRAAFRAVLSGSGLDFTLHPDRVEIRSGPSA